jgi:hypothetical protein
MIIKMSWRSRGSDDADQKLRATLQEHVFKGIQKIVFTKELFCYQLGHRNLIAGQN